MTYIGLKAKYNLPNSSMTSTYMEAKGYSENLRLVFRLGIGSLGFGLGSRWAARHLLGCEEATGRHVPNFLGTAWTPTTWYPTTIEAILLLYLGLGSGGPERVLGRLMAQ